MKTLNVGIVGCGTIGTTLASRIKKNFSHQLRIKCVNDINEQNIFNFKRKVEKKIASCTLKELIGACDIVVESASSSVSFQVATASLKAHKKVLILSIGGLVFHYAKLMNYLKRTNGELWLPSGALCGIDGMLAAKVGGIKRVELITRKPIAGLIGAPYFELKKINLNRVNKEKIVFSGPAEKAIKYFPKNVNVAALLSLVTLGIKRTKVTIITSPSYTKNSHEVIVESSSGVIRTITHNLPAPSNPKTSYLTILSAEATLAKQLSRIKVGT